MTLFFCLGKPAARGIRTGRARISRASAPTLVPVFSARSAVDATAAVIAADSVDAADARMGVPIVPIAAATVDRIAVPIVAVIVDRIAAEDASNVAADMARIVGITAATLLLAGPNSFPKC